MRRFYLLVDELRPLTVDGAPVWFETTADARQFEKDLLHSNWHTIIRTKVTDNSISECEARKILRERGEI